MPGTAAAREIGAEHVLPLASFYLAGTSCLLGWNMVLTFSHLFDCGLFGGNRWAGSGFPFWCSLAYSAANPLAQVLLASRWVLDTFSFGVRWCVGILGSVAGIIGLLFCDVVGTVDAGLDPIFFAALAFVFLLGTGSAIFQGSCFGLAGAISPRLVHAVMMGQGISGVLACLVGFAFQDTRTVLIVSFVATAFFNMLGIPLYFHSLRRNPLVLSKSERADPSQVPFPPTPESVPASSPLAGECGGLMRRRSSFDILSRSTWPQALTVGFVFAVTFTVFPGVVTRWRPAERVTRTIATFQLLDVLGRMAPGAACLRIENGRIVSLCAFARLVFVPAFMLLEQSESAWASGALLQFSLMAAFAFSNGYVSTLSMMLGPSQSGTSPDEMEPAGALMSLFLVLGIFVGCLLSLLTQIGVESPVNCPTAF